LRKKVLVRAPVLTRSGYGEHGRFVLRALRSREDLFEVYVIPVSWGETGWLTSNNEERKWMDERIKATAEYGGAGGHFDISIQVTIPNEWEKMAPINIGVTAGIETTKVAPVWLEKANMMDKIVTISEHSKNSFLGTIYDGVNSQTQQKMVLKCEKDIDVVHYPVKKYENLPDLNLDLEYDFNYLAMAQSGPRKNLENTVRWFVEENIDQKVGLVLKTFIKNESSVDRQYAEEMLSSILLTYPDRKCKVYLLHGEMSDAEIHSLYVHPKIKCMISATHGEGFGLPLFEAAYSALPIIASGWSGQCDFLYAPYQGTDAKKKNSKKVQPYFSEVDYTLGPVPENAVWEGVIQRDSMWCYPQEGSFKMKLRRVRKNYKKWEKRASTLQKWILENFEKELMYKKFVDNIVDKEETKADVDAWLRELDPDIVASN
tara:strand:- start:1236 stop:2525 length:1290 start_codon:yes stop_codon:yes gene_type:complete